MYLIWYVMCHDLGMICGYHQYFLCIFLRIYDVFNPICDMLWFGDVEESICNQLKTMKKKSLVPRHLALPTGTKDVFSTSVNKVYTDMKNLK